MKNVLIYGEITFHDNIIDIEEVQGIICAREDIIMELGEEKLLEGFDAYFILDVMKDKVISNNEWVFNSEDGDMVVFDKQLRLACGFRDMEEVLMEYPNAKLVTLGEYKWEYYEG